MPRPYRAATAETHIHGDGDSEKLLLAAVFARAVRDLVVYSRGRSAEERLLAEGARQWLFESTEDQDSITSFSSICLVMNLDEARVRRQLRDWLPQATALAVGSVTPSCCE